MIIYILTSMYNDYDQHGEYFIKAFKEKPAIDELRNLINEDDNVLINLINNGGGRMGVEYCWYYLKSVEL